MIYRWSEQLDLTPGWLRDRIEELDQFERWPPRLTDSRVDGPGQSTGSGLHGVVTTPPPYRM